MITSDVLMTAQDFLSHTVILYVRTESALEPWPLRAPQEVKPLKSFLYHRRGVDHPGLVLADANSLPGTWGSARWPLLLLEEWWLKVGSVFCIQGSSLCLDVKDKCVVGCSCTVSQSLLGSFVRHSPAYHDDDVGLMGRLYTALWRTCVQHNREKTC